MRAHVESLARQGDPDEIERLANLPKLPPLAAHVWRYFRDMRSTGGHTGFGPARLTRLEIHQWEEDELIALEPWERRAILAIDAVWVATSYKAQPKG